MDYIKRLPGRITHAVSTDFTINRTIRYASKAFHAAPTATAHYLVDRVPVVHWLPKYNPRWLLNDALAGITVGVLLIPQSLAYAKIATIPGEYGLMSSWLPNFLVFIMGTSKDLSTGPTSLMGLLTAEIIADVLQDGYSAQAIASAVAMSVGIYALAIGLLKLGFLLEFISVPVLSGFISAAAIVIMLGQIPSLFGITTRSGTANTIHDIFAKLPRWDGATTGIGLGGILILVLMQKMGQRWGKNNKAIWLLALGRSALVLILFTGISYGVNKNRDDDPIWALSKVRSQGIADPHMPDGVLIKKVFPRSIAPFIAAALEHLAIAKAFGRKNNYTTDAAQELVYLGTTNFFNAFFASMPVGGAMSRTAVNSDAGVKSPAYGVIAGGVVILSIFKLSPALYWIPKATLAAIIVTAVWHIVIPPSVFYSYWRVSLTDFTASQLAFWLTLFVSSEIGIATAVAFSIAMHLLSVAFAPTPLTTVLPSPSDPHPHPYPPHLPRNTPLFTLPHPLLFPNAYHTKSLILSTLTTHTSPSPSPSDQDPTSRSWSTASQTRAARLRAAANISISSSHSASQSQSQSRPPPRLSALVLDWSMVRDTDTTALVAMRDLVGEVCTYGGTGTEVVFLGVRERVWGRLERFGWVLRGDVALSGGPSGGAGDAVSEGAGTRVFSDLAGVLAWVAGRSRSRADADADADADAEVDEVRVIGSEKFSV